MLAQCNAEIKRFRSSFSCSDLLWRTLSIDATMPSWILVTLRGCKTRKLIVNTHTIYNRLLTESTLSHIATLHFYTATKHKRYTWQYYKKYAQLMVTDRHHVNFHGHPLLWCLFDYFLPWKMTIKPTKQASSKTTTLSVQVNGTRQQTRLPRQLWSMLIPDRTKSMCC